MFENNKQLILFELCVLLFMALLVYLMGSQVKELRMVRNEALVMSAIVPSPFTYRFNVPGILYEAGRLEESSSPYFWLNSGGLMTIASGTGMTNIGDLPTGSKWRNIYAVTNPLDTDGGLHPQNIFRLITRSTWDNLRQEAYFRVVRDQLSMSPNRNSSNGLLLMSRYKDGNNLYYAGLRTDGQAVIKKKLLGLYTTLALAPVFPGVYDRSSPSLIPKSVWIGLRSETVTNMDGSVRIRLYTDIGRTGVWTLQTEITDDGRKYGTAISAPAYAGIRTDFMDTEFQGYKLANLPPPF